MSARGALKGLLTLVLMAATAPAVAASFGLSPLSLSIAANELSGSVLVTNTGTDDVVIQAKPYAWTQSGKDARDDTQALIVNPPIFKLAAGSQQLVRVASRGAPPREVERAFRVVFSEVPVASSTPAPGFRISIAMDIPLFVEPMARGAPQVMWRLEHIGDRSRLVAENRGGRHLRLREVQVLDGTRLVDTVARIVVLAKSSFVIDLPETAKGARALQLVGNDDDDQRVSVDVPAAR
ncbi:MAG TPA: fimbria/pilus periplasmic chaperone [Burkholderiaceae bacterium]|nr:fimbria/pilus periplasmic chaperone [Burkholderiaceae bacterium]